MDDRLYNEYRHRRANFTRRQRAKRLLAIETSREIANCDIHNRVRANYSSFLSRQVDSKT